MAEGNEQYWNVMRGGKDYGAFPEAILRQWIASGKIASDVKLSCGGAWISSDEFLHAPAPLAPLSLSGDEAAVEVGAAVGIASTAVANEETAVGQLGISGDTVVGTALPPAEADARPRRDQIVVLGRRQSGKTVYLATLYSMLWRGVRGISAKALTGTGHRELMHVAQTLREGAWPHATRGVTPIEMEISYDGKKRTMTTLDFAGELFAKAFLYDRGDAREVKPLLDHIDRSAAVMLLVDPAVTVGRDPDAAMEDDFGLVQAAQRLRNWPDAAEVPVVFLLTKSDVHQPIVEAAGGPVAFVRRHFPALARTLRKIKIYQVSAVQCLREADGTLTPNPASTPVNIERPLFYCLGMMEQEELEKQARQRQLAEQAQSQRIAEQKAVRERRHIRWLIAALAAIFAAGAAGVGYVIYNSGGFR